MRRTPPVTLGGFVSSSDLRRLSGSERGAGQVNDADARLMRRAIELAARGWGRVSPNPLVGAVVARDGRVVGEGWHRRAGADHAEVAALQAAGEAARGATLYVTLEPCAHRGRTPPCTGAILEAGIRRVVAASRDPNPEAGAGLARLRTAGLEVSVGTEAETACRLNAPFLWRHSRGVPLGALKLALTLDARLAERPGVRSTITGSSARTEVHHLRAGHDVILVGRRTATVDDPRLTARGEQSPRRPPVRVILDPDLRLSPRANLVRTARTVPTWVVAAPDVEPRRQAALEAAGVRVLQVVRRAPHELDLVAVWRVLAREGVASVLVEGGGRTAVSLLRAGLLQRMHLIYAPLLFGQEGVPAFPGLGRERSEDWRLVEGRVLEEDFLLLLEHRKLVALTRELARPLGD